MFHHIQKELLIEWHRLQLYLKMVKRRLYQRNKKHHQDQQIHQHLMQEYHLRDLKNEIDDYVDHEY